MTKNYKRFIGITVFMCMIILALFIKEPIPANAAPSSNLTLNSSSTFLNNTFTWAKGQALSLVQTGNSGDIACYWAGYLSRNAFYGRDTAHQMFGAHLLGLDNENFTMLKQFAGSATSARIYYPLWSFGFDGSIFATDYKSDTNFVRELPTPFELVERAYQQYLWTNNTNYINDSTLWTYYQNTLGNFITNHDQNSNGLADENNSGSFWNGIPTYNEQSGEYGIEAGDSAGSQLQATLAYSNIQKARGDSTGAATTLATANNLKNYFNTNWFDTSAGRYIRVKSTTTTYSDFGKENSWFMPMKLIIGAGQAADSYVDYVNSSVHLRTQFNVEAYSYLPEAFFKWGHNEQGWSWLQYIMNSRNTYPEISYTIIGHIADGLMGITPNAPNNSISTLPRLPQALTWVELNHIPLGTNDVYVKHDLNGNKTTFTNNSGSATISWNAQFYGDFSSLNVNGTSQPAYNTVINGKTVSYVTVSVPVGSSYYVTTGVADTAPTYYEAEATGNTLSGTAAVSSNSNCSGGKDVTGIGNGTGNYITFNNVNVPITGNYTLTMDYLVSGNSSFYISINGGTGVQVPLVGVSTSYPQSETITVTLNSGNNTIQFYNNSAAAPALDRIGVMLADGTTTEAEDAGNTLSGTARVSSASGCSGGQKVGYLGNGAANYVILNNVNAPVVGTYKMVIGYLVNGTRTFYYSVNGGADQSIDCTGTSFAVPAYLSVPVSLNAGNNTIKFHNDTAYAPDLDRIMISPDLGTSYEAESFDSTLSGSAIAKNVANCSGGQKVGNIGNNANNYVIINNVMCETPGTYTMTIQYCLSGSRTFNYNVNGGTDSSIALTGTDWNTPTTVTVPVTLIEGRNTIKFHNDTAYAPDLDKIIIFWE